MDLNILKGSTIVVELNIEFGFNIKFLNKYFDNICLNILPLEKILKFVRLGGSITNDLKNFVRFVIMNGEKYRLIGGFNALSAFAIGYNKHIGFLDFKTDILGFNKATYCKVLKNSYTKNCLMLNIKSQNIDINNRYFIVPNDMYETVFNDEPVNEVFDRVMIKTFGLKIPYSKGIPLSALLFEYEQYSEQIKINHDSYYLQDNNYLRYLVNIFFDYYGVEKDFKSFIDFLKNRGIKVYNDLNQEYIHQITLDQYFEHEVEVQKGFELINYVYYNQLINFIKSNKGLYKDTFSFSEYEKFLKKIEELKEKNIKFNKNLILFILKKKSDILFKNKYFDFIESL